MEVVSRNWLKIVVWSIVLGVIASLIVDWGQWDQFFPAVLWRILIVGAGCVVGPNIIESMGVVRFSNVTPRKIENSFVFTGALVAAIASVIFIR